MNSLQVGEEVSLRLHVFYTVRRSTWWINLSIMSLCRSFQDRSKSQFCHIWFRTPHPKLLVKVGDWQLGTWRRLNILCCIGGIAHLALDRTLHWKFFKLSSDVTPHNWNPTMHHNTARQTIFVIFMEDSNISWDRSICKFKTLSYNVQISCYVLFGEMAEPTCSYINAGKKRPPGRRPLSASPPSTWCLCSWPPFMFMNKSQIKYHFEL